MNLIKQFEVIQYVEDNIGFFHISRLQSMNALKLKGILKKKNPYLFKAKNILKAQDLVEGLLSAHLSSSEEGIFGTFLEGLAIYICGKTYDGWKSGIPGIDLEFNKEGIRYIVSIKSGPNWGNSRQIAQLKNSFKSAKVIIRTNNSKLNVVAVNGCCYGKEGKFDKGDYYKYCGQKFWEFISGSKSLYRDIIEPLGYKAKEKNEEYLQAYSVIVNKFTSEFSADFVTNGLINWEKIVEFNSSE